MSLLHTLKCLINERLSAAAEDLFGAIEIILTEYEDDKTLHYKQHIENQHSPILDIRAHAAGLFIWLIDWLVDWLIGWLIDWLHILFAIPIGKADRTVQFKYKFDCSLKKKEWQLFNWGPYSSLLNS